MHYNSTLLMHAIHEMFIHETGIINSQFLYPQKFTILHTTAELVFKLNVIPVKFTGDTTCHSDT